VTAGDVNAAFETAAEGELEGVLGVTNDDIVSSDLQQPYSTLVDLENTNVVGDMTKVLTWYDNEYGFSSRMLDVAPARPRIPGVALGSRFFFVVRSLLSRIRAGGARCRAAEHW